MAVSVKAITLWRGEVDNRPGILAQTLEPLAKTGTDLHVVMGYRYPGNESRAAIELYPVSSKKAVAAAQAGGLSAMSVPVLKVEGDNKPGLGYAIAKAIADGGMNLNFVVAQVIGKKYSALFGFETEEERRKAASLIKKTAARKR